MGSRPLTPCLLFCGPQPRPTLVLSTDIHLVPEAFYGPIPAVIELSDVDCAFTLLELLEAVEALSHVAEASFVLLGPVAVPGTPFRLSCGSQAHNDGLHLDDSRQGCGHLFEHVPASERVEASA